MRKILTVVVLALLVSLTASAQNAEKTRKLEPLPRDLEIQLALSALPPHLILSCIHIDTNDKLSSRSFESWRRMCDPREHFRRRPRSS
jgi:hypothetical protein